MAPRKGSRFLSLLSRKPPHGFSLPIGASSPAREGAATSAPRTLPRDVPPTPPFFRGARFRSLSGGASRILLIGPPAKEGPVNPTFPGRPGSAGIHRPYEWWVTEGLARGSHPSMTMLTDLRARGFQSVVSLRAESNADEGPAAQLGMRYLRLSIIDNTAPTTAQMKTFLDFVTDASNGPVYVHCYAGVGRTGVAVAVYQMAVEGMKPGDALAQARSFGMHMPSQIAFVKQFGDDLAAGKIPGYPMHLAPGAGPHLAGVALSR